MKYKQRRKPCCVECGGGQMLLCSFSRCHTWRPLQTLPTTKPQNRTTSNALVTFSRWLRLKKNTRLSLSLQPAMTPACIDGYFLRVWLVLGGLVLADVCSAQMAWGGRYHLSCVKKRKVILSPPYTWPHTSFQSTSQCVNETKCFSLSKSWQASAISRFAPESEKLTSNAV